MTRGGISIDQKMVDSFIRSKVKNPSDLENGIDLTDLTGSNEKVTWSDVVDFLSRGLCLDLQRKERKYETLKTSDIKGAIESQDPVGYLRSKGYQDKTIQKIFNR